MAEWRTTTRDFFYFKQQAQGWIKKLGLLHYRTIFFHKDGDEPGIQSAYGWFKSSANVANIGLAVTWDRPITRLQLRQTALHEVLHILFDNLTYAGTQRFTPMGFIEAEEEEVIARLERVLLNGKTIC